MDRLGDDLGLVAVDDDAGGELLRNGERVEHQGSLLGGRSGRNRRRRPLDSGRLRGEATAVFEGTVPPSGRLVRDAANRQLDPREQRLESRRVVGEPRGLAGGNHVNVEMRLRDVNAYGRIGYLSCSCACHSSLHAHVSIQDVGKDGGDQTALRPLDGLRRTRSDHRLPGGALPGAPLGWAHLKAHSSPIVNRQAEDPRSGLTAGTDRAW